MDFPILAATTSTSKEILIIYQNIWRDFGVIAKQAGIVRYAKPLHSLRKSCITDWAGRFGAHVVKEWAGHEDIDTTLKFYLKVPDAEYQRAAGLLETTKAGGTQLVTQPTVLPLPICRKSKAGDGIRTHDVQLGKLAFYH